MFEAVDGGGAFHALPAEKAVVKVQLETLRDFKGRIDRVLATLDSSAASPKTVGVERIDADHLGTGFTEASALFEKYNHVHGQLETFSGLLADQIEAMQITVDGARKGFSHVDLEQSERVWAIHRRTQRYDKHPDQQTTTDPTCAPTTPVPTQGTSDGTGGTAG